MTSPAPNPALAQAPALAAIARALGGEVCGREVMAPGPGHSARDRSLSVKLSSTAPDGLLVHSFAGDDWKECRDYVRARLAWGTFTPACGRPTRCSPLRAPEDSLQNQKVALRIWCEAGYPRASLVEHYLQSRGLELPDEAANSAIRFHEETAFGEVYLPAMICLVRNIRTNAPQAIQRTALSRDGTAIKRAGKTLRLSLGPSFEGAIKLDPDEDVEQGLCIGEGVETTLSGRQMEGLHPAWALLNTGGIANFPILPGIDGLQILMENDANGASARAAQRCASRWHLAGREVLIVTPDADCNDLNDELRRGLSPWQQ
jgi:hypothetical protein